MKRIDCQNNYSKKKLKFEQEALNLEEEICGVRPAEEEDDRLWTDVWELGGSKLTEAHMS